MEAMFECEDEDEEEKVAFIITAAAHSASYCPGKRTKMQDFPC